MSQVLISMVCVYVITCILLGFKDASRIKTLKEFALGYKGISTPVLIATMYATHMGAGSTIGFIEGICSKGIVCIIAALGSAFSWYITKVIYSKNLDRFEGCISHSHVMERLYGEFGFIMSSIIGMFACIITVAIQVVAIGFLVQYFFGLSETISISIGAIIVTSYAASGGVKAVILTDIVQFILFGAIILCIFILVAQNVDKNTDFWSTIPKAKMWIMPYDLHSTLIVMGMIVYAFIPMGQYTPFMQRILISGSNTQMSKVFSYTMYIDLAVMSCITLIGIFLLPTAGDETLTRVNIFEMVNNSAHPSIVVATVIGILAVTMSTADSWLNAGSVIITQTILRYVRPNISDNKQVLTARLATIALGIVSTYVGFIGDSLLSLLLIGACFIAPLSFIPTAAGFLGYQCTSKDYKRAVLFAIPFIFLGRYIEGRFEFISLLFGNIGSAVGLSWPYKWTFKTSDGTPIIEIPKFNSFQNMFCVLLVALCMMYGVLHSYIDNKWLMHDTLILICFITAAAALFFSIYDQSKYFKYSICISSIALIASSTAFSFRTNNPAAIIYTIAIIIIMLVHRYKISIIMIGLTIGFLSYIYFNQFILFSPQVSTLMLVASFLTLTGFYLLIYNELTITQLEDIEELVNTDPLTGLYNMRYKHEEMLKPFKNANRDQTSVIAIDIDNFKKLNDEHKSHEFGDAVLRTVANIIKENTRKADTPIRRGGDEFILILPYTSYIDADIIAKRISITIASTNVSLKEHSSGCTISYGISTTQSNDTCIWDIVAKADSALYDAKATRTKIANLTIPGE